MMSEFISNEFNVISNKDLELESESLCGVNNFDHVPTGNNKISKTMKNIAKDFLLKYKIEQINSNSLVNFAEMNQFTAVNYSSHALAEAPEIVLDEDNSINLMRSPQITCCKCVLKYSHDSCRHFISSDNFTAETNTVRNCINNTMQGCDLQDKTSDKYDNSYANSILLWNPSKLPEKEVEDYLKQFCDIKTKNIPTGDHLRDNEQDLYLLLHCKHNVQEALRYKRLYPLSLVNTMHPWSEKECRRFEEGFKIYGKDFNMIQMFKVRSRTVKELVEFYYLWKKTERYDEFAVRFKTEKEKYYLNPGGMDYMDMFMYNQNIPQTGHSVVLSVSGQIPCV